MVVGKLIDIFLSDLEDLGSWRTSHQSRMRSMVHGMVIRCRSDSTGDGLHEDRADVVDGSESTGGGGGDGEISQHGMSGTPGCEDESGTQNCEFDLLEGQERPPPRRRVVAASSSRRHFNDVIRRQAVRRVSRDSRDQ